MISTISQARPNVEVYIRADSSRSRRRAIKFNNNLNKCGLIDLGSSGPKLTCTNGQKGLGNALFRLDRAIANASWIEAFPEAIVRTLPRLYSDHSPLLIDLKGTSSPLPKSLNKPFRLEAILENPRLFPILTTCLFSRTSSKKR